MHKRGIKWVRFLDYLDYEKGESVKRLTKEFGYEPYLYKHYESVFTRLYQGVILPKKFNIDKRKNHLSALIMAGEISRDKALEQLNDIPFESKEAMQADISFFLKSLDGKKQNLMNI